MSKNKKTNRTGKGQLKNEVFNASNADKNPKTVTKTTPIKDDNKPQIEEIKVSESKYFRSDLARLAFSAGLIVVLFAVVVLVNSQTTHIEDFTDTLVEIAHIN